MSCPKEAVADKSVYGLEERQVHGREPKKSHLFQEDREPARSLQGKEDKRTWSHRPHKFRILDLILTPALGLLFWSLCKNETPRCYSVYQREEATWIAIQQLEKNEELYSISAMASESVLRGDGLRDIHFLIFVKRNSWVWKKKGCGQSRGVSGPPLPVLEETEVHLQGTVKTQKYPMRCLSTGMLSLLFFSFSFSACYLIQNKTIDQT